ncbi:MAG TPA: sulfurtransferase TusA family protein [Candidatus Obscuribacterales bacterium]
MDEIVHSLDLRGVACPMNFVKTKLFLDKLPAEARVDVLLDAGEPVDSVTQSLQAEGHHIERTVAEPGGHYRISVRKG